MRLPAKAGLHDEIVRVSIQLGSELGEEALTMRAIAAHLGVSATALYQHFESKAAILREIRLHGVRMLRRSLEEVEADDATRRLAALAERYVDFALNNPWLYKVLFFGDEVDWGEVDVEEREELLAPLSIVHQCLENGIHRGVFRSDLEIHHTALMLWSSMHGLATMLMDGRISASHPVFPVEDVPAFVRGYIEGVARGLEPSETRA